jgi:hypothetical protein
MNAAGELGAVGAELAAARLRDPDLSVRLAAARALIAAAPARSDEARGVLTAALDTPLALDAADELQRLGDARGRDTLAAAARAPATATRRLAVALLAASAPASLLAAALCDADAVVRLTAARGLLRRALRPYLL